MSIEVVINPADQTDNLHGGRRIADGQKTVLVRFESEPLLIDMPSSAPTSKTSLRACRRVAVREPQKNEYRR
jgi:hypothetical protein